MFVWTERRDSKGWAVLAQPSPNCHSAALCAAVGRTAANAVPSLQALAASTYAAVHSTYAGPAARIHSFLLIAPIPLTVA